MYKINTKIMLIVLFCIQSISIFGMEPGEGSRQTDKLSLPYLFFGVAISTVVWHQIVRPCMDGEHNSFFLESLERLHQYYKNNGRAPVDPREVLQPAVQQPVQPLAQPPAQLSAAPVGEGLYPTMLPGPFSQAQRDAAQLGQVYSPFVPGDPPCIPEEESKFNGEQSGQQRVQQNGFSGYYAAAEKVELDEWGRPRTDRDAQIAFAEQQRLNRQVAEGFDQEERDVIAAERLDRQLNGGGSGHDSNWPSENDEDYWRDGGDTWPPGSDRRGGLPGPGHSLGGYGSSRVGDRGGGDRERAGKKPEFDKRTGRLIGWISEN